MDAALRNNLWNALYGTILVGWDALKLLEHSRHLAWQFWDLVYKERVTEIPSRGYDVVRTVEERFKKVPWHDVYDQIEFFIQFAPTPQASILRGRVDEVLKRELSAYRVVGNQLSSITSEEEIAAVEESEQLKDKFKVVGEHIKEAVRKMSSRTAPDYRNSIKEAISAVEAVCRLSTGKNTFSVALKSLSQTGIIVHPSISQAFDKIYGYTSDADGIRHSLIDSDLLDFDDAKFMLVACSAFINLVRARTP